MKNLILLLLTTFTVVSSQAALVYVPSRFRAQQAKLVVVIHGCLQSPEVMAFGAGWNQLAEQNQFLVLYPEVPQGTHPLGCWGWYLPENQRKDSGQLKMIMDEIKSVKKTYQLKNPEVYLTGVSSGGATVAGLMACFPKDFKAGAIHSGGSYGLVQDMASAEKLMKEGPPEATTKGPCKPQDYKGAVFVIHGNQDPVVNMKNAERILLDFAGPMKDPGKKEVREGYTITDVPGVSGIRRGRLVMVEGLGHAWSGSTDNLKHSQMLGPQGKFPTVIPFFSEKGPNATQMMWDFFQEVSKK
ncbi:MAG: PHB depolymerase family esterase [Pseudobdellovibrionaceae bacterium]